MEGFACLELEHTQNSLTSDNCLKNLMSAELIHGDPSSLTFFLLPLFILIKNRRKKLSFNLRLPSFKPDVLFVQKCCCRHQDEYAGYKYTLIRHIFFLPNNTNINKKPEGKRLFKGRLGSQEQFFCFNCV